MTVKQIKEKLNEFPEDSLVVVNSDELYNHYTDQVNVEMNEIYEAKTNNLYYFDKQFALNDNPIKAVIISEIIK